MRIEIKKNQGKKHELRLSLRQWALETGFSVSTLSKLMKRAQEPVSRQGVSLAELLAALQGSPTRSILRRNGKLVMWG